MVITAMRWLMLLAHAVAPDVPGTTIHQPTVIVISDVRIVDMMHARVTKPRHVLIENGQITAIETSRITPLPPTAQRIDGRGRYVMPGLIDMHVHLFNLSSGRAPNDWAFPMFVAHGVTAVRDMRADLAAVAQVRQWRQEFDAQTRILPRILATGVAPRGASVAEIEAQLDAAVTAGADFIKVFSELPPTAWRALMERAQERGIAVVGHTPARLPLLEAARAGQRDNEHLTQVFEACSTQEDAALAARASLTAVELMALVTAQEADILTHFDARRCARVAATLASTQQAQVPTLVLPYHEARHDRRALAAHPLWPLLRTDEQVRWRRLLDALPSDDDALAQRRWRVAQHLVRQLHRADVLIFAGTDAPMPRVYPGLSLHEELAQLVESGFRPIEALRAATLEPATFLGVDRTLGSVDVGKQADLILLDADPTRDIDNLSRIDAVILAGRVFTRAQLDALLHAPQSTP